MGLALKCLKYTLFAFNLLFWILGLTVLGIGIYSLISTKQYHDLLKGGDMLLNAGNLLIACGVFVSLVGFVGCWGAFRQNKCCLIVYMAFIVLIFVMEIAAGIFAYVKKDDIAGIVENNLKKIVDKEYGKEGVASKGIEKAVDWVQKKMTCCGFAGPADWKDNDNWTKNGTRTTLTPDSCCKDETKGGCLVANAYKKGCKDAVVEFIKSNIKYIGAVGVGIGIFQLIGLVIAIVLYRHEKFGDHETM